MVLDLTVYTYTCRDEEIEGSVVPQRVQNTHRIPDIPVTRAPSLGQVCDYVDFYFTILIWSV